MSGKILYIGGGATPERHNYVKKQMQMIASGELLLMPGKLTIVDIYHDDWCASNTGGICDCDPIIKQRGDPRDN